MILFKPPKQETIAKKNLFKKILLLFFSSLFFIYSFVIIYFSQLFSHQLFLEFFKYIQFLLLVFLVVVVFNHRKILSSLFLSILFFFHFAVFCFFVFTTSRLDYQFFLKYAKNYKVFQEELSLLLLVGVIISLLNTLPFKWVKVERGRAVLISLLLLLVAGSFMLPVKMNDSSLYFIKTIFADNKVIDHYQENIYKQFIRRSGQNRDKILRQAQNIKLQEKPDYLDNVIFLQLESLNSLLVKPGITPNFIQAGQKGVYFPNFYSNDVQTITGQESILCGTPPSFYLTLRQGGRDKKVSCLPRIFEHMGYETFFYKTYGLKFTNTGQFMENIGFQHVHAEDIMKENDPEYTWGYREDVFYQRALNHFQDKKGEQNLLYLEVGPTNHWPFKKPADVDMELPYENADTLKKRLANTSHIQDHYLGTALERIKEIFPEKNYTLIILSDHSWPLGIHEDNVFNQAGAYEENYLTPLVIQPGGEYAGRKIETRHSQMDILPTFLDLFNLPYDKNPFARSLLPEIKRESSSKKHNILLIQPFSEKQLGLVKGDQKLQYNSRTNQYLIYDLKNSPREKAEKSQKAKELFWQRLNSFKIWPQ
ncbi:MAG TPA: sulfatase-like hydrolase/transferase [Patescibacteria group bacterium]|nr:sulfatase-like hydrolase/transferase [Patescibacteria group bacterium]